MKLWFWTRMEKISWIDRVKNEEVLRRVKNEGNTLQTIKRRNAKWVGHMLRRNYLLRHVIEGKINGRIEVKRRRGRRRNQLPDDLMERDDTENWKMKHYFALDAGLTLELSVDFS